MDREISAGTVIACLLWALSFALCAGAWVTADINVGRLSLILCGAAVTATIRTYFVTLSRRIKAALIVAATEDPSDRVHSIR